MTNAYGTLLPSCTQDALWLAERLSPNSPAHRIKRVHRIVGRFDADALLAAWETILERYDVLREAFVEDDGRPYGIVVPPFGENGAPLAWLGVRRLGPAEHRVTMELHRLVADDRSADVITRELSALYAGRELPSPAADYDEYARWQCGLRGAFGELRRWWADELTPLPPTPVLPVDRPRPDRPSIEGGEVTFDWGQDVAADLAALCRAERVPPETVLLAAFQALLHRYGGEDLVPVGVPVDVRPGELADVVGPCRNLVVVTGDVAGAPTFRTLLGRTATAWRDAHEHRELPFTDLLHAVGAPRAPGRIPLCDAMFVRREVPAALELPGAEVTTAAGTGAPADLTLTVERLQPSIAGTLGYRTALFDHRSAAAILDQLRTLVTAALADPDTPVAALPMDSAAPLGSPDATDAEPVHELIRRQDHASPAVGDVSYGELERDVAAITSALVSLGATGRAVAIRMAHGPRQVAASLGALRAGAHLVWFGTGDAGERGRLVLDELRPACLLREAGPSDALATWFADELGGHVVDVEALATRPNPATPPTLATSSALATWGAQASDVQLELPEWHEAEVSAARAYVAYTSGSTGRPKGIAQTHGAFAQFVTWMATALDLGPGARVAQWVAPEHDPSLCEVFATLVAGGTLCPPPQRIRVHPEKFLAWLDEERITFLQTVPSFARELLKAMKAKPTAQPTALRRLVLMGEAVPADLVHGLRAALPGVRLTNMYGPTETIAATWCDLPDDPGVTVPIGTAIPGREVLLLDEAGRPCPAGVTGEIVIRSPYVCDGYLNRAAGPAFEPIGDVRTYRTGDLACRRWDGLLEFRGRKDFQVKLLGNRVELAEVEAALAEVESVAECAVVPLTDDDGLVVQLVAYVVPRGPAATRQWRAHLRRRFGESMVLVSFEALDERLPRNVAGKVDRARLPAPRGAGADRAEAEAAPRSWVEHDVAQIWTALLGAAPCGTDQTFFAAGGHSLLMPQLADRIRKRFGVEVPLWDLFAGCTVAHISAHISPHTAAATSPTGEGEAAA